MMSDLLIGGGSVGVLTGLGYGILKFLESKKSNGNGNGNSKRPGCEVIQRIDRWTIQHDAQSSKLIDLTTQQVLMTREMRDAILLMADRRNADR